MDKFSFGKTNRVLSLFFPTTFHFFVFDFGNFCFFTKNTRKNENYFKLIKFMHVGYCKKKEHHNNRY